MIVDYIDASALVAMILKQPHSRFIDRTIRQTLAPLLVSDLCLAECSSAIAITGRREGFDEATTRHLWGELDIWVMTFSERIATDPEDIQVANDIVRQLDLKLRGPDAIHVATAARLGARLITLDRRMADAAHTLGLSCINPADEPADGKI